MKAAASFGCFDFASRVNVQPPSVAVVSPVPPSFVGKGTATVLGSRSGLVCLIAPSAHEPSTIIATSPFMYGVASAYPVLGFCGISLFW